jgi:S-methylmethionine-dependent homocysteine/selenocysteine methylase
VTGGHYLAEQPVSPVYERVDHTLAAGGCVLLDGGVATELQRIRSEGRARKREPWGTWALFQGPMDVLEMHRRYVASGCDVISTNTWSVLEAADESGVAQAAVGRNPLWVDAARLGVRLARQAVAEAGRDSDCAAAFCVNSTLLDERARGKLELLSWVWHEEPPDLVILETLESVPDDVALETIALVTATGLPVWVSFRRRREGMSTVDGGLLPDPDPSAFPRALERLQDIGVRAVLVNCVPVADIEDTLAWLRDQTALPIGCYPNLGHSEGARWEFDAGVGPQEYARMAAAWRAAGARIVGGCCGVTPQHIAALRAVVDAPAETPPLGTGS